MNDIATILDNPIWSALMSENSAFGSGTDCGRLFDSDIAPFAGLISDTSGNFRELFDLADQERVVVLFSPKPDLDPFPFETVVKVPGYQMVFEPELPDGILESDLVPLGEKDIPAMLALTQLTQPGPFAERTIVFGGYRGIFDGDLLVAMGGQRLQTKYSTEISAICTHPEYNGRGYGRRIVYELVRDITKAGKIAYLHVRADNNRAIELYRRMGFAIRSDMNFYVLKKPTGTNVRNGL